MAGHGIRVGKFCDGTPKPLSLSVHCYFSVYKQLLVTTLATHKQQVLACLYYCHIYICSNFVSMSMSPITFYFIHSNNRCRSVSWSVDCHVRCCRYCTSEIIQEWVKYSLLLFCVVYLQLMSTVFASVRVQSQTVMHCCSRSVSCWKSFSGRE